MKLETLVFDDVKNIIPMNAVKTVLFANVADMSYELFFYCWFSDGSIKQCYQLAEEGILDAVLLDQSFEKIAKKIKEDAKYKSGNYNVFTFVFDRDGVQADVAYYDKDVKLYKMKKEWKAKYSIL